MKRKIYTAAFMLLLFSGAAWADGSYRNTPVAPKNRVAKKKAAIKLYPNPSTNGTVRVVSNTAGTVNFYIFALDGTLLHQAAIAENQKHKVSNLQKGVYTYDVFYNDEGIEHGQLIVK